MKFPRYELEKDSGRQKQIICLYLTSGLCPRCSLPINYDGFSPLSGLYPYSCAFCGFHADTTEKMF
jgi:hypothetical protein